MSFNKQDDRPSGNEQNLNDERKIAYWECDTEKEILSHQHEDEAIEDYLEDLEAKDYPLELEVHGYARMIINKEKFKASVLETAYDFISEQYDGEDGHEQCEKIEKAAAQFVETYLENYHTWACEPITKKTLNVAEWVQKNRPDWLVSEGDNELPYPV